MEAKSRFYDRLISTINVIIENDLPPLEKINYETTHKLKKVIALLADSAPFKVNVSELSRKSGLSRDMLLRLLQTLNLANLLSFVRQAGAPTGHLTKTDKLYLNNTALLFALNTNPGAALGTARETFFVNQLSLNHKVNSVPKGDFLVDNRFIFEVGGKNKTKKQIAGMKQAFIAADDLEYGVENKIPLWLFGLLY